MLLLKTALVLIFSFCTVSSFANERTLVFGVVPQQSATTLAKLWGPLLAELRKASGLNIQFSTAPNIPEFEARVARGEYDVAYMNPYHFTVFHETPGYKAIAKAKDKRIKGLIVTRIDSPLASLEDLEGSTLAFPAPKAFAATLLTQANLRKRGVDFQAKYVSSHDSVYQSVAKGLYPAGGGIVRTLENMPEAIQKQLKVLWLSDGYTPHAVAVSPSLDKQTASLVQKHLLALDSTDAGRRILEDLNMKGFETATDSDWDDVRSLKIDGQGDSK